MRENFDELELIDTGFNRKQISYDLYFYSMTVGDITFITNMNDNASDGYIVEIADIEHKPIRNGRDLAEIIRILAGE